MRMEARYADALAAIPNEGSGVHSWIMSVANLGAIAELAPAEVERDMRAVVPARRQRSRPREIGEAIGKAYRERRDLGTWTPTYRPTVPPPKPPFDGPTVFSRLIAESSGTGPTDLAALSPIPIGGMAATGFLTALYSPEEWLFTGGPYNTSVHQVANLVGDPARLATAPHIIPNPLTGRMHETKSGRMSYRCDAAVKALRFAVVEFDDVTRDDQCSFWSTVIQRKLLRVAALIDSGGKSLHAWVRVDLPDADAWQREIRDGLYDKHAGTLAILGADPACKNPSRLSRMPGHVRQETGRVQELLYLDPTWQLVRPVSPQVRACASTKGGGPAWEPTLV